MTMKCNREDSSMLDTYPQVKPHKHLHIFNSCQHPCIMMIMVGSKMSKTQYDLKAIMYPAYDTPHKLCNIWGNQNIRQPRLPSNNAGRPMRQFKCLLTWLNWRAGSPPVRLFLMRGWRGCGCGCGCVGVGVVGTLAYSACHCFMT